MNSFELFRSRCDSKAQVHIDRTRRFCLSLGDSVVESVRAHRIVYGKGMTMRWFVDVCPGEDSTTIKIQQGRREEPLIVVIPYKDDISAVFPQIKTAYCTLH
ncbi:MAG: hypothetical protein F4097_06010 [Cenarchaeum sp. SB0672_bin_9]|nr:hypothetical protein [Cenarchaeum sp. SB0664_bin_35]MYJ28299.1 hypothetical protein [Cenarchaeum sp. SB0672_bin_9]